MKRNKLAVIDFTKFDIQQLPELQGKKEEIKKVIKENPVVKVTDNASYELAKKSRTAVKTLRTSLEKEKKEVNDRIKKSVLEVVANEYDSLISDVKNDENARQEEVSAWEGKKEQERLEKLRLEQERVDGIKKSIGDFRLDNERTVESMVFQDIDAIKSVFEERVANFDRASLAEFEVLFDDTVAYLDNLLNARIATLTEQENIRIAQIELAKERERIEAEQKRIAEEQRIAQENFLREKREFEEKQLKLRTESRIKQLTDLGIHEDVIFDELGSGQWRNHKAISETATDEMWAEHLEWTKEQIELRNKKSEVTTPAVMTEEDAFKPNESAKEEWHEADVDPRGIPAEEVIEFDALGGETWREIFAEWKYKLEHQDTTDVYFSLETYLESNFNVPTRKQQ